ncbi:hypothetical protein FB567DRAFT_79441 [Paraphoma chrysanthemicola]|uniref:Uncharacterized protein n=1 Tax=Paraphoma chrysanthemicola TaxID=798071 RepID=A0A8K0VXM6_9PLEO|nr:hypothetical protein FB567DRAFT_79441 [Paraphoma chrysanthemicola]
MDTICQTESPLLRLPAEIRNMIYSYAITTTTIYTSAIGRVFFCVLPDNTNPSSKGRVPTISLHRQITLPQVCRQLRAETYSLLFAINTLEISGLRCSSTTDDYPADVRNAVEVLRVQLWPHLDSELELFIGSLAKWERLRRIILLPSQQKLSRWELDEP